ncbi:MAG: esterase-like activity of phytase family protein [Cyanobacteriota bacterium]|nr:esterase-like activity of phytase family protein [Cyanobacteriota bacterium]
MAWNALAWVLLTALVVGRPAAAAVPLPCPLAAGWRQVVLDQLPRRDGNGLPVGGLSAMGPVPQAIGATALELLSDAPEPVLVRIDGLGTGQGLRIIERRPLTSGVGAALPPMIDGEGLVRRGNDLWVASEGRRSDDRPAQLLRFDGAGRLRQAIAMPRDWQPQPGRGLVANGGPESLSLLQQPGQADALLMAAEYPLLQDPPGEVRLLVWSLATMPPSPQPLVSLRLPGSDWGLTDLLPVADGRGGTRLLALLRRFATPDRWGARLALYPLPPPRPAGEGRPAPLAPLLSWDLLAGGDTGPALPADNWEALALGPPLPDGTPTLVLASDDNFSPFQANHLALLAPRRLPSCHPLP